MASTSISRAEQAMLETLEDDEIFAMYLELGSVGKLLEFLGRLFELKSKKDGEPKPMMRLPFYRWLDAVEGRRDMWERSMEYRRAGRIEEMIDLADTADMTNVQLRRLMVDARYKAGKLEEVKALERGKVEVNINMAWLEGMKREPITEVGYTIESDSSEESG